MKKLFILPVLVVLTMLLITVVNAQVAGVGSPDTECQNNGFDYGIAKYQCNSYEPEEGSAFDSYDLTVEWFGGEDCSSADWTADPAVDGVLSKEGTSTYVHLGGTSGTITQTGQNSISHVTFCGKVPQVPEFGTMVGILTVLSAVGVFFIIRRK